MRWFADVVAPFAAPKIAEYAGSTTTFMVAAAAALAAMAVLLARRRHLGRFARPHEEEIVSEVTASSTP